MHPNVQRRAAATENGLVQRRRHRRSPPRLALLLLLTALFCTASWSRGEGFSAGAARREITPSTNLINWVSKKPYPGVLDPLYARALVLSDGARELVLLSWDLVDCREGIVAKVRASIQEATGIPGTNVIVNASHSHSAPWAPTLGDVLLAAEKRTLGIVEESPAHAAWSKLLVDQCVDAVRAAQAERRSATMTIGRARADEVLFNRRPRRPDGTVETMFEPADPYSLPRGLRFGPTDPTLTVLGFRGTNGLPIATVFHLSCHAVCVYPHDSRLSADWPGAAARLLEESPGGEAIFLQGCAGDIVPVRRGLNPAQAMGELVASRARSALTNGLAVTPMRLATLSASVNLPLTESARQDIGSPTARGEVQVLWLGEVALVAFPGEPLVGLALAIKEHSPFPHTLVLGYSNGGGVQYVGLPGEKALGGYEMGAVSAGDDSCGRLLLETALELLRRRTVQELRLSR